MKSHNRVSLIDIQTEATRRNISLLFVPTEPHTRMKLSYSCPSCAGEIPTLISSFLARCRHNSAMLCKKCTRTEASLKRSIPTEEKSLGHLCPDILPYWSEQNTLSPFQVHARTTRRKVYVCLPEDKGEIRYTSPCNLMEWCRRRANEKTTKVCDLSGQVFGGLRVLSTEAVKGKGYSVCECKCGKTCKVTNANLIRGNTTSCGCRRNTHYHTLLDSHGYVRVYVPLTEVNKYISNKIKPPHSSAKGVRVMKHIMVMAEFLGRPIDTEYESIHHKNGIRSDNDITNLELRGSFHGKGQAILDLVRSARKILSLYDEDYKTYLLQKNTIQGGLKDDTE